MSSFSKGGEPQIMPGKRPAYVRWTFYLLCLCFLLLLILTAGLIYFGISTGGLAGLSPLRTDKIIYGEIRRDLAGKLLSAGLKGKAIEQYERYLSETGLPADRRATLAFTLGKLCMEEARYEDALSWLYQVEIIDPKTTLAPEVGAKIVACLENLGRFSQAQYSLDARSSLDKEKTDEFKGGRIVATIGKDQITLEEMMETIKALPEWMRPPLKEPHQKEAFLRQYVAEELLYRKAEKLELDEDPLVRKLAERAFRQLMVQKVLEKELQNKVSISADDIALYYKANKDRYREKEAYRIRLLKIKADQLQQVEKALSGPETFEAAVRQYSLDMTTREEGGLIDTWIEEGLDPTGMGDPDKLWQALAGHKESEITQPVLLKDECYIFQIVSHRPPKELNMEEAGKRVEQDLSKERLEKAYQELILQALQVSEVKLFPEVFYEAGEGKEDSN